MIFSARGALVVQALMRTGPRDWVPAAVWPALLGGVLSLRADMHMVVVPVGQHRVVACPFEGPGGGGVVPFVQPAPEFIQFQLSRAQAQWLSPILIPYAWDWFFDTWDGAEPELVVGEGVILEAQLGEVTLEFSGSPRAAAAPLDLAPGLHLLGSQTHGLGTFQSVTGQAPREGARLFKFNPGPGADAFQLAPPHYTLYLFSAGAWSPSTPSLDTAEAVWIYQPACFRTARLSSGGIRLEFRSALGETNYLDYTETLPDGPWLTWTNLIGDGAVQAFELPLGTGSAAHRFYRLRL